MQLRTVLSALLICGALSSASAQDRPEHATSAIHQLDLNAFAASESSAGKAHKKIRIEREAHSWRSDSVLQRPDSMYVLTRFPPPSGKHFAITAIESQAGVFDTGQLSLHFVVLQLHNGDTVFKEFPLMPTTEKMRSKQRQRLSLGDSGIVLQPAPFYLGYIYRPKQGVKSYRYNSYTASAGGEGAWLFIRNGSWRLARSQFYQILPFKIEYAE